MSSLHATALDTTTRALLAPGRGILAADESGPTITRRFAALGIEPTEENRRRYRQLLFGTPEETLVQHADDGRTFVDVLNGQGIVPGIKMDSGTAPLPNAPGEFITEGLDGLRERLADHAKLGTRFAKWRAVITIGEARPTRYALRANAHALARYAALCQELGIVPIVEPEVLMDGHHSLERAFAVTQATLEHVFAALREQRVVLEYLLLKPNMVVPGLGSPERPTDEEVAAATLRCLRRTVPAAVPGVVFLSGGQDPSRATGRLHALNAGGPQPWRLTFSFARALQDDAMAAWQGVAANVGAAQWAFLARARANGAASDGRAPEGEPERGPGQLRDG